MKKIATLLLCAFCVAASAQSRLTEHTLHLDGPEAMPAASIDDLAWLSGRWLGEGFGGVLEENWNPPLGSYHMGNPGADMFNLEADDVPAPKRQAEIEEVVKKLAAFKPTKIAVESPLGDSLTIARYKNYLAGTHQLRRAEEEQIGFRLAKMLGHETIYPIDVRMGLDQSGLEQVIAADPARHGPRMALLEEMGREAIAQMGRWLKEGTIADMLYEMNRPEFLDLNYQLYLRIFLPAVHGDNYAGADLVAGWNHRNLRIMSNLHQIGCTPDDRVLVIFGQGHVPLFERIAKDSPYFEVVDVLGYLR